MIRHLHLGTRACTLTGVSAKNTKPPVEHKQAFAGQQAKRDVGGFTGKSPIGTGPENRHGMPKLPVGQRETQGHWPVLDLGTVPEIPPAEWRLTIGGLVDMPHTYTWEEFLALPQTENASDFHCVTGWSMMDSCWTGVRFADLAQRAGVQHDAHCVFVTAYDIAPGSETSYTTNLGLDEAMQPDVMLVH